MLIHFSATVSAAFDAVHRNTASRLPRSHVSSEERLFTGLYSPSCVAAQGSKGKWVKLPLSVNYVASNA